MTAPQTGSSADAVDVDAALAVIREQGLRVSTTRRLTVAVLYEADRPLTAEQIAEQVAGGAATDVASVYRNLETLEQIGLVRHFHLGHSPGLYVRSGAGVREYLVCDSCQAVRSVAPSELENVREELRRKFGWEARFAHSPISGLCESCAGTGTGPGVRLSLAGQRIDAGERDAKG